MAIMKQVLSVLLAAMATSPIAVCSGAPGTYGNSAGAGPGGFAGTGIGGPTGGNLGVTPSGGAGGQKQLDLWVWGYSRPVVPIILDQRDGPHPNGVYSFNFLTGNGIVRQERGYPEGGMVSQQGQWSFTYPDGTPTTVTFVADANGFRVDSDRVPPLPPHAAAQIEKARLEDTAAAAAASGYQVSGGPLAGSGSVITDSGSLLAGSSGALVPQLSGVGSGSLLGPAVQTSKPYGKL
ncbi:pupal cuticle protein 20-like [Macrobrachium rosenbergii]|uniref:pupal cuticle protein 20-like n=1 Tax=Macrobrachium rosenbergii TaxID=79674 RepID=UPI0034D78A2C